MATVKNADILSTTLCRISIDPVTGTNTQLDEYTTRI
jgi:hypothetical protein